MYIIFDFLNFFYFLCPTFSIYTFGVSGFLRLQGCSRKVAHTIFIKTSHMKKSKLVNWSLDPLMTAYSLQCAFDVCKLVREAACSVGSPRSFTDSLLVAMREIHSCLVVCDVHIK